MIVKIVSDEMYPYYLVKDDRGAIEYEVPNDILNAYQKAQKKFERARNDLKKYIANG
jgi:hypothetical protein